MWIFIRLVVGLLIFSFGAETMKGTITPIYFSPCGFFTSLAIMLVGAGFFSWGLYPLCG